MNRYYLRGKRVYDFDLIKKIERDSCRCWWHQGMEPDKTFTGYINTEGEYFDVCLVVSKKTWKKCEDRREKFEKEFNYFKKSLDDNSKKITDFFNLLDNISEIKSELRNINKKLRNKYVIEESNRKTGKRSRRYKKDNKRYLTDQEIQNLVERKKDLSQLEIQKSKKVNLEEMLYTVHRTADGIDLELAKKFRMKYDYSETELLYKDYIEILDRLKDKVNGIAYNDLREEEKKDLKLGDIDVFQKAEEKVLERIIEEKEDEEKMRVLDRRKVTKKAKFYIDENGIRRELSNSVSQVVIHQ
jgi:hypothetical protein